MLRHRRGQAVWVIVERLRQVALFGQDVGLVVDDDKTPRRSLVSRIADAHDHVYGTGEMTGELDSENPRREALCPGPEGIVLVKMVQHERADVTIGREAALAPKAELEAELAQAVAASEITQPPAVEQRAER